MKKLISSLFPYKSASWYVLLALFAYIIYLTFDFGVPQPLAWDTMGYHVYLTELFTDGDLLIPNLEYYEGIMATYENTSSLYQFIPLDAEIGGGYITKYTAGWAVLHGPFIYLGHWYAGWMGYPQDGFSMPYQVSAIIASLFYTLLGLLFLRKIFLHFFTEKLTVVLLVILVLGTNYLHMNSACTGLAHVSLFTLYAALLYFTIQFHKKNSFKSAILIGLSLGFLALIRPTELVAALIPLLYGVTSWTTFKTRFTELFKTHFYWIAIVSMILVGSIQLFVWKYTTGSFLFYSYVHNGEALDFIRPHVIDVLFSFRKGWLIYTPVMALLILGFIGVYKKHKALFIGTLAFTVINLYVISCWTVWWYAGSFSSRALEHSYPIYILLIGFGLMGLANYKKVVIGIFVTLCIVLNLFQTFQMRHDILHTSHMTKAYYFSVFGQTTSPTPEQRALLLINREQTEFNNPTDYNLIATIQPEFDLPMLLDSGTPQTPLIKLPYNELTEKDHLWIRAKATVEIADELIRYQEETFAVHLAVCMLYKERTYSWRNEPLERFESNEMTLTKEYLTPDLRTLGDEVAIRVWLQYGANVLVKSLYFEVYEPKNQID
ncbi:MAG: hypothetical protein GQ574_06620 [Crocinitomix sp.]|nr:hypothetical protein [Crocinitomix sp.]